MQPPTMSNGLPLLVVVVALIYRALPQLELQPGPSLLTPSGFISRCGAQVVAVVLVLVKQLQQHVQEELEALQVHI